jgi:restriction endonuclease Mrr
MSDKPTKLVVNCTTKEEQVIELTDEEIEQIELSAIAFATEKEEREAAAEEVATLKESGKAKLAALGLTAEEIDAIIN